MRVKAAPVQLPEREGTAGAAVAVGERMDRLEAIVEHGGAEHGRKTGRGAVPPVQKLEHEAGDVAGRGRHVPADPYLDRAVAARLALVHHAGGKDAVQGENVVVPDGRGVGVRLHVTQAGEVVEHLAPRARLGEGRVAALFKRTHFFECERIAFDGRRGVDVARARVLLQRRDPRELDRRSLDAFAQSGDRLHQAEQTRTDLEMRLVGHAVSQASVKL